MKISDSRIQNIKKAIRIFFRIMFIIYLLLLLLVIVLKYPSGMTRPAIEALLHGGHISRMEPKLIPFKTIITYVSSVQAVHDWFFKNLAANIVAFIPFGFMLPIISKPHHRKAAYVIGCGFVLSSAIEVLQYFTALGVCDVDDIILNTLSVALGYGIYKILYLIFEVTNEKIF